MVTSLCSTAGSRDLLEILDRSKSVGLHAKTREIFRFVTDFLLLIEIVQADMIGLEARFFHKI